MKYLFGVMALVSASVIMAGDEGKDYVYHEGYDAYQKLLVEDLKKFNPLFDKMCSGDFENRYERSVAKSNCDRAVNALHLLKITPSFAEERCFALSDDIAGSVLNYSAYIACKQKRDQLKEQACKHFVPESQTKNPNS
jgi:hypothetical protein